MNYRIIAILGAIALIGACDKGGKKKPHGKAVTVKSDEGAKNAKPAAKAEASPKKGDVKKARGTVDLANARGLKIDRVNKRDVPLALRKGAKRPARPQAKKVDPVVAQKAAKVQLPKKGAAEPKVEIIEVSDFQCPYCNRVNPTIKKLLTNYGNDVRVRFLHQPLAFHKDAKPAAIASAAAQRQGKFWDYHDKLFANQRRLKEPQLIQYAKELAAADSSFNFNRWMKDYKDPVLDAFVERNRATANAVRATGTPMFFVNGKTLRGAQPYPKFEELVKSEIQAAKKSRGDAWIATRTKANNRALAAYVYEGKTPPASAARRASNRKRPREDKSIYKVSIDLEKDAVKGNKASALVTLVEFSEFQCPFCRKINPTLDKVLATYKDKVRVVFKHSPLSFHKDAMGASEASLCAKDQGKFWEMHDVLFSNQRKLKAEHLEQYATDLKLDLDKFKKCMSSHKYQPQIKADQALASKVNARGTPNVFVNGRNIRGARPFADFKRIIDEQLARAEALVKGGAPIARVYEAAIKNGKIREPLASKVTPIAIGNSARIGSPKAKIQIVEFSDFQCPFCSRITGTLKALQKHYGKKAVLVFKNFPLRMHKEAKPAAIAALCAKAQGKFWPYHDLLFKKYRELRGAKQDKFVAFATESGVPNIKKFTQCLADPAIAKQVDSEMAEGMKVGVRGTPSIYINGRKFSPMGAGYTVQAMTSIIDREILNKK